MTMFGARTLNITASTLTLGLALTACAAHHPVAEMNAAIGKAEVAQGTPSRVLIDQAETARTQGNPDAAVSFSELAVRADPNDAAARKLLAKSYFDAGRFASAADAYGDLQAMSAADTNARFEGALAALAAGHADAALDALGRLEARPELAADVGLALALAGKADKAVALLTDAVRNGDSSARTRQNLALSQALAGQWTAARVTAAVDLSPDQVDARVAQWAALASSNNSAWRTQHMLGVTPAAVDAGRPVQLAWSAPAPAAVLAKPPTRSADATVTPAQPVREIAAKLPQANPPEDLFKAAAVRPPVLAAKPVSPVSPVSSASVLKPAPVALAVAALPAPVKPAAAGLPVTFGDKALHPAVAKVPPVRVAALAKAPTVRPQTVTRASLEMPAPKPVVAVKREIRPLPKAGGGIWVVQLGSYAALDYLVEGWQGLLETNKLLGDYKPLKSTVDLDGDTYYRLSVGGFGTSADAGALCENLKAAGASCFVRKGAGAPDADEDGKHA